MTVQEIERTLPNGFHDCVLKAIDVILKKMTIALELEIDFSDTLSQEPLYKRAKLDLKGVRAYNMDCLRLINGATWAGAERVDFGFEPLKTDSSPAFKFEENRSFWIFFHKLNSFAFVTCGDAKIKLDQDGA